MSVEIIHLQYLRSGLGSMTGSESDSDLQIKVESYKWRYRCGVCDRT